MRVDQAKRLKDLEAENARLISASVAWGSSDSASSRVRFIGRN